MFPLTAQRGTIYDANMKVLAQSATVWKIVLNPNYVKDDETRTLIANGLAEILDMEPDDIMKALQKKNLLLQN